MPETVDIPAIEARGLTRRFGDLAAVDGLTFEIAAGSLFGLLGPDGAGKSTLIRMLATVIAPTSGDADVFGHSVTRDAKAVKPRIGYMSQRFSLYGDLTMRENLDFFGELRGVGRADRRERGDRLLELMGIAEFSRRQAQYLSGGMKQKLALAATLIHEPELLFLDEPTTGVDPVSRREFWRIISGLHRRGITVFVATPYMDEAERCTELAFMQDGHVVLRDTPAGVKARVPGRLMEVAVADPRKAAAVLREHPEIGRADVFGEVVQVLVANDDVDRCEESVRSTLEAAGMRVHSVREAPIGMESAFSALIQPSSGPGVAR